MGNRKNLPQHGQPNPALGLSAANFTEKILRRLCADAVTYQGSRAISWISGRCKFESCRSVATSATVIVKNLQIIFVAGL